ncbi:MAG: aminoglycoside phosphotransferase family protein [Chloroflexota bacterium]|nr:aminoglycoside phosphotransferase family protein [Chloroflexota bacterium]
MPALVADLARRWDVIVGSPFALSYNYVAAATRSDGTEGVLKVGFPRHELEREIAAVRLNGGDGMCRLLECDDGVCAMLLERLRPGETLAGLARTDDTAATRIGAEVMRRLWRPVPDSADGGPFRPVAEWFRAFDRHRAAHGGPGPFPASLLDRAEALARELLASAPARVLLHGDFHHYNVLSARRAPWLAIDPKGMTGDPGYEVGPFLLNPNQETWYLNPDVLRRRLEILADELGYDRARLRDWGIAHAVLSACWSVEDHGEGWHDAIAAAELFNDL